MAEKIYTSDELMLEVASVTPREYDGCPLKKRGIKNEKNNQRQNVQH